MLGKVAIQYSNRQVAIDPIVANASNLTVQLHSIVSLT
jgi:hypothetical protein